MIVILLADLVPSLQSVVLKLLTIFDTLRTMMCQANVDLGPIANIHIAITNRGTVADSGACPRATGWQRCWARMVAKEVSGSAARCTSGNAGANASAATRSTVRTRFKIEKTIELAARRRPRANGWSSANGGSCAAFRPSANGWSSADGWPACLWSRWNRGP